MTLSLPCFSNIFLSATTRVSTFSPPTLLELMGDLFALPISSVAGMANSSGMTKRSSPGGLGASRKAIKERKEGREGRERGSMRQRQRLGERLGREGQTNELSLSWLMPGDKNKASSVFWSGNSLLTGFLPPPREGQIKV